MENRIPGMNTTWAPQGLLHKVKMSTQPLSLYVLYASFYYTQITLCYIKHSFPHSIFFCFTDITVSIFMYYYVFIYYLRSSFGCSLYILLLSIIPSSIYANLVICTNKIHCSLYFYFCVLYIFYHMTVFFSCNTVNYDSYIT